MKIVRPICCGMHVHKDLIVATIAISDKQGITIYKQESFTSRSVDSFRLKDCLTQNNSFEACIESTGK